MKLVEKKNQYRRDFTGIYQCENCGYQEEIGGCYDDDYFHKEVAPAMKCEKCGKSTLDLGLKPVNIKTKYKDWEVV